jgi:SsrA-binding protein
MALKTNGETIITNRRARFDYQIEQVFEAGIVLTGSEVKSLRLGQATLAQAHASYDPRENAVMLYGASIEEYNHAGTHVQHARQRPRPLLLKRKEIQKLIGALDREGMTLVPIRLYFTLKGKVKLELGLAKGKKQHEKRDAIKDRDWQRQKERLLRD